MIGLPKKPSTTTPLPPLSPSRRLLSLLRFQTISVLLAVILTDVVLITASPQFPLSDPDSNNEISVNGSSTEVDHPSLSPPVVGTETTVAKRSDIDIVTEECNRRCEDEESSFVDEFGIECGREDINEKCFRSRCNKGCERWWSALKDFEPCDESCSSTKFYPIDMPCIVACEMAQRQYWRRQHAAMETVVAQSRPRLLNSSLTAYSLTLRWPITFADNYLASRPFNIQYQYVHANRSLGDGIELDDDRDGQAVEDWHNLADYNCNELFDCEINGGLMPFTEYRFRFELPFGEAVGGVLHSPPTEVIMTEAAGVPIWPPIFVEVLALDSTHVSVHWRTGPFSNGPLRGFRLLMRTTDDNDTVELVLPAHRRSYIGNGLRPSTNYTVQLTMLNADGEGASGEIFVLTPDPETVSAANVEFGEVLRIGDFGIGVSSLDAESWLESRSLYESVASIQDYAVHWAARLLFVVDTAGAISRLRLGNGSDVTLMALEGGQSLSEWKPMRLAVDWLNQKLYVAGELQNASWMIVRSNLTTDEGTGRLEVVATGLGEPIQQLSVDPVNGWLFWSHATPQGGLSRLNLATRYIQTISRNAPIGYFVNDFHSFLLIAFNRTDNQLHELSYDGVYRARWQGCQPHHRNGSATSVVHLAGEWLSFALFAGNLLATNGTHLLHQDCRRSDATTVLAMEESERCWSVLPLSRQLQQLQGLLQPEPRPNGSPQHLQALLTAHMANISWSPPAGRSLVYQTAYAWRRWEYELEIMDVASNSAFNIRNIRSVHFVVDKLQANNLYKLRVRASSAEGQPVEQGETAHKGSGEWSAELRSRTWPLGERKLLWAHASGLFESNEIASDGGRGRRLGGDELAGIRNFVQLNGTIYFVSQQRRLRCVHVMNPEVNCTIAGVGGSDGVLVADADFVGGDPQGLAYDWRGAKLYWTDRRRNCVIRANLDGSQPEMLPIFGAGQIHVDPDNGRVYYSTRFRLVSRTLGASFNADEVEYFHVNGLSGHIRGFAVDVAQGQLYWIVRHNEGTVRLRKSSINGQQTPQRVQEVMLDHDIEAGSLEYLPEIESLLWMQRNRSRAVLMRADKLDNVAVIQLDASLGRVSAVRLENEFTPFLDQSVIPEPVVANSVRIDDGYWDDFNIKWRSTTTAENHTIFYKVLLLYGERDRSRLHSMEVAEPFVRITEFQQPLLPVNVSITPHTYWHAGPTVTRQLRTPAAAPTQPKRLRIFVQRVDRPLAETSNISAFIRWDPPENITQNTDVSYKVYCWLGEELCAERLQNYSGATPLEAVVHNLKLAETYTFQVQAFAAGRSKGGEKTAFHALHINPEVQSVPRLLYATTEFIGELDLDLNSRKVLVYTSSEVDHLAVMTGEQRLLWVNSNIELMSFVVGSAPIKLARMRAVVLSLTVDWVRRLVYWAEKDSETERTVSVYRLDLNQFEGRVMLGTKVFSTQKGHLMRDLVVLPFSQSLLWLDQKFGERNGTLAGRNLTDLSELQFKGAGLVKMFEDSLSAEQETVNLVDYRGKVCSYDVQRHICTPIKVHVNLMSDDIGGIDRDSGYMYVLKNDTVRAYNRRKQSLEYLVEMTDVIRIRSYNYHEYPKRQCLLPQESRSQESRDGSADPYRPTALQVGESFITLAMPDVPTGADCWVETPGIRYSLTVMGPTLARNISTFEKNLNLTHLLPHTEYSMQVQVATYYQQKLGLSLPESDIFVVRTAEGTPSVPRDFVAFAASPTEILVSWSPPKHLNAAKVWYQLHWRRDNSTLEAHKITDGHSVSLLNLDPLQQYSVWVKVCATEGKCSSSATISVSTFERPRQLLLEERTAYNLTLSWIPTANLTSAVLVCQAMNGESVFSADITHASSYIMVPNLEPKTQYAFHLELWYGSVSRAYVWPELYSERFVYETLGDAPGRPGQPLIEHITGEIFKVSWEPAQTNGEPIAQYSLEALQLRNALRRRRRRRRRRDTSSSNTSADMNLPNELLWVEEPQPLEDQWSVYCNTTELSCIVRELHSKRLIMFRVRARNEAHGWGPYSRDSERLAEPLLSPQKRDSLVIAIVAPAIIVSTCVVALVLLHLVKSRRRRNKKLLEKSRPSIWSNMSAVQQQQQFANRGRAFSVTSNGSTMYTGGPLSDADIALLPQINWNQITILNFLGSGAFGEVYEGLLKQPGETDVEKVAIKSLRKGASEFAEILQEAQLMSNFRHENIVRLIGISFDADSIAIIMEHMEGGDLLSYLREARPTPARPTAALQTMDLMTMCIDVATGCAYLEDMHFVHRDLACRNCLVSSRVPSRRVVKIGDFGLARDIYKHDYYRKEGEGLLPVRWMSPESLVDGVFTTQSDVWAFAVLCWEILTLGQQPYLARTNFEVLNYVKEGGRLEQPPNCPDKLFALLQQCWLSDPEARPTFRKCLNTLLTIKTDVRRTSLGVSGEQEDCAMYANASGIMLSTFLATPLSPVVEEELEGSDVVNLELDGILDIGNEDDDDDDEEVKDADDDRFKLENPWQKDANAKGSCGSSTSEKDMEMVGTSDVAGLVKPKAKKSDKQLQDACYENEGVSRF